MWLTSRCMSMQFPSFSQSDPPLFCHIRVQNQGLKTHNSVRLCPAVVLFPSGTFSCKLALPAAWWWHNDDILQLFVLCLCFSGGKQQVWLWIVDGRYIRFQTTVLYLTFIIKPSNPPTSPLIFQKASSNLLHFNCTSYFLSDLPLKFLISQIYFVKRFLWCYWSERGFAFCSCSCV